MKKFIFFIFLVLLSMNSYAGSYAVKTFSMDFLMDAPVEKIKGKSSGATGKIEVDENNLASVKGSLLLDLSTITLHTFDDPEKNTTQTSHMLNWFEIGSEVSSEMKNKFQKAVLDIKKATHVEKISETESKITVDASLTLHGITKDKSIELTVLKKDKGYTVKTAKPFLVALKEHDVRPRDIAGKLLQKTLEALGEKVAENAQVNVEVSFE